MKIAAQALALMALTMTLAIMARAYANAPCVRLNNCIEVMSEY
jgi:hypothetical protein